MNEKNNIFPDRLEEITSELKDDYAYIKCYAKYYWINMKKFFSSSDVANNIMCTDKELRWLRQYETIKTYNNVCYMKWWKKGCLNLLNEEDILLPSDKPVLDDDIKTLIENVCGYKKENIEYLHKAILYKYHNLNDFTIPAIVFYWVWWSGKWTLISLLWTMFWDENVLWNLWQRDLSWSFDTFNGQKLVVEFAEVSSNNYWNDMKVLNKLKNMIWAKMITVNEKFVNSYQIENIAWFFISSNSNKPLRLDDKDKWNRRFTIIRSISKLDKGKEINISVKNKEKVQNYLAWLYKNYSYVLKYDRLDPLDNEDKRDLEDRSQHEANNFWDWVISNKPDFRGKKRKPEVDLLITDYCFANNIEEKEFLKYFWDYSRFPKKKIRIGLETISWVDIPENENINI